MSNLFPYPAKPVRDGDRWSCPSCGSPLSGPGNSLRVVSVEEHAYDIVTLEAAESGFTAVADPGSPEFLSTTTSFAICANCTQELSASVSWDAGA